MVFRRVNPVVGQELMDGAARPVKSGIETVLSQVDVRQPEMSPVRELARRYRARLERGLKASIILRQRMHHGT